jgi:hypothetical protein
MVKGITWIALLLLIPTAGCSRTTAAPSGEKGSAASEPPVAPGLGQVMSEVGHRFEMAGRAANANRFELAAFEVGELQELFETDVPRASMPKEGPTAHIPAMAKAFLEAVPPDLTRAAASKDQAVFATAFQRAAAMCNACHQASAKVFIQVPAVPGHAVPDLDPLPAPPTVPR